MESRSSYQALYISLKFLSKLTSFKSSLSCKQKKLHCYVADLLLYYWIYIFFHNYLIAVQACIKEEMTGIYAQQLEELDYSCDKI